MKNLILLFTIVFAFGFSQTIQAQPVPGEVVTKTQTEKPEKGTKGNCEKGKKSKAKKANASCKRVNGKLTRHAPKNGKAMKANNQRKGKGQCQKGKKGKAVKAKNVNQKGKKSSCCRSGKKKR